MKVRLLILLMAFLTYCQISNAQVIQEYLFSDAINEKVRTEKNVKNLQNLAVQYSFSGNYRASLETQNTFIANRGQPYQLPMTQTFKKEYKLTNAVRAIAKESEKYSVVITNEAHYQPQNRVFTTSLLQALYDKGFRYFAFEDFTPNDTSSKSKNDVELNSRKYAIKETGYYIAEPQYGNLVREAIRIGFKVVPYEHYANDLTDPVERLFGREKGQAQNIANIVKSDPKAKILVHCGYGHLNEYFDEQGQMGGYLKQEFKIDALSIDQQTLLEENRNLFSTVFDVKEPSVLVNSKNSYFSNSYESTRGNFKVDISIVFPKTSYINERPNWLMYAKNRKYVFVKTNEIKIGYPLMVLAYHKGENSESAIPADVIELSKSNQKKALVLYKGDYILIIKNPKGESQQIQISVK